MKVTRILIGVLSIVISAYMFFQASLVGVFFNGTGDISGSMGALVAVFILIAGIAALASGNSTGGTMFSGVMHALGGVIGIVTMNVYGGAYGDLLVWSGVAAIFGIIMLFCAIQMGKNRASADSDEKEISIETLTDKELIAWINYRQNQLDALKAERERRLKNLQGDLPSDFNK